jgi:hypothetical protein
MPNVTSSADRDAWLEALTAALGSDSASSRPISSRLIAACEKHLRDNSRHGAHSIHSLR